MAAACAGTQPGPRDPPPDVWTTGITGSVTAAACEPTDNPLRFRCAVSVDPPGPVTVTVGDRRWTLPAAGTHDVLLWGLPPDHGLTWEVRADGGSAHGGLHTGVPRGGAADLVGSVAGAGLGTWFAAPVQCGGEALAVVLDSDGVLRWYESMLSGERGITGFAWTPTGPLVHADGRMWQEGLDGTAGPVWNGAPLALHHAATTWGDRQVALSASVVDGRVVDGVVVVEDGVLATHWQTSDAIDLASLPPERSAYWERRFPVADDITHANAVSVLDDGLALVSLRWLDSVWAVDLVSGDVRWWLGRRGPEGVTGMAWPTVDPVIGQHDARWVDGSRVAVFDNGPVDTPSRGVVLHLDPSAGQAEVVLELPLERHCNIQGSVAPVDGGWLVTCAAPGLVTRFDDAGAWLGEVQLMCPDGQGVLVARAEPVDGEPGGG